MFATDKYNNPNICNLILHWPLAESSENISDWFSNWLTNELNNWMISWATKWLINWRYILIYFLSSVVQELEKISEPGGSSPPSEDPETGLCPEKAHISLPISLINILILSFQLHLSVPEVWHQSAVYNYIYSWRVSVHRCGLAAGNKKNETRVVTLLQHLK
jgi:hypothetical protein